MQIYVREDLSIALSEVDQRNTIFADMHENFRKIRFAKLCHRDMELMEHNVYHCIVFEQIPLLLQKSMKISGRSDL